MITMWEIPVIRFAPGHREGLSSQRIDVLLNALRPGHVEGET